MEYIGRVYRPPSEAFSYILQATVGCPYNQCTFCSMYKGEEFTIRPLEEIEADILQTARDYPFIKKVFLADGDCLIMKTEDLAWIFELLVENFEDLEKISLYGTTQSIQGKSLQELKDLKTMGLDMIYLGVESGSDEVLSKIKKGVTAEEIIQGGKKVMEAGILLSTTFISGLGGKAFSQNHAQETARLLNALEPDYIGLLALLLEPRAPLYQELARGDFAYLSPHVILLETQEMVKNLTLSKGVFRANHASNYVNLRGTFPEDKEKILADIERGLSLSEATLSGKHRAL